MIHPQNYQEIEFLISSIRGSSYLGVFLLAAIVGYLIPFPEAILLLLFGFVARINHLNIFLVLLLGSAGSIVGDNILYRFSFLGSKYVQRFNQKMRQHKLIQYEHLVADNIGKAIYFLRFVTGVRFFGPVIAGTLGIKWKKFIFYNAQATALHSALFILLGYFYRGRILPLIAEVEIIRNVLLFSSAVIIGMILSIFASKKVKANT